MGARWRRSDIDALLVLYDAGLTYRAIGERLTRPLKGVACKVRTLNLGRRKNQATTLRLHDIALQLRDIRLRRRLSRRQLSKRIGVGISSLHEWEHGRRSPTLARADFWAQALGLRLELTSGDNP